MALELTRHSASGAKMFTAFGTDGNAPRLCLFTSPADGLLHQSLSWSCDCAREYTLQARQNPSKCWQFTCSRIFCNRKLYLERRRETSIPALIEGMTKK